MGGAGAGHGAGGRARSLTRTNLSRMAEVEDSVRFWSLQRDLLIHEMRCEDVGFHLYSQMCCAGRSGWGAAGGGRGGPAAPRLRTGLIKVPEHLR